MTTFEVVYAFLVTLGLTYGVVESSLFSIPRVWLASRHIGLEALLYCSRCSGFWCAALVAVLWPHVPLALFAPLAFVGGLIGLELVGGGSPFSTAWEAERSIREALRAAREAPRTSNSEVDDGKA